MSYLWSVVWRALVSQVSAFVVLAMGFPFVQYLIRQTAFPWQKMVVTASVVIIGLAASIIAYGVVMPRLIRSMPAPEPQASRQGSA